MHIKSQAASSDLCIPRLLLCIAGILTAPFQLPGCPFTIVQPSLMVSPCFPRWATVFEHPQEHSAQEAVNLCSEVLREEQQQLVREFRQDGPSRCWNGGVDSALTIGLSHLILSVAIILKGDAHSIQALYC